MKEYCVDLEIAKELKENGFPQESFIDWLYNATDEWCLVSQECSAYDKDRWVEIDKNRVCSAPTSDEILKELPNQIEKRRLEIIAGENSFLAIYEKGNMKLSGHLNDKLSNSLASLWLNLKKEGYMK